MSLSVLAAARQAPHAEALVCDGQRLSFSQLAQRVLARRAQFAELGEQDTRTGALVADGSLAMFELM